MMPVLSSSMSVKYGAIIAAAVIWARHAFAAKDWTMGSATHGNAKPIGTLLSRSEVTKLVNNYVKEKDLKTKHAIAPDAALKKLLAIPEGDQLTYFNLQKYLNRHYVKTEKAVAAAVKA